MPENRKQRQAIAGAVLAALLLGFILFLWLGIRWYTSQDNGTFVVPQTTASQSPAQAANKTAALRQTAALLNQMASALSTAGPLPTSRPANTLDLLVVDADTQKPIPGIAIISGFAKERFRGTTAVNGHVYVPMPTGRVNNFNIAVRGKKYVPVRRQWYGGNMNGENFPTSLTMELQRGVAIGGRVVDEYGQPVDGAEIHISVWADSPGDEIYDGNSASGYRTVRTNADGRWRFTNVPPQCQSIQIGIQAPGYVGDLARLRDFTPMSQLYARTAVITLARGLDCYATVLGPDGKPVTGADVAIGDDQDMWDPAGPGLTDQSGRFHTKFAAGKEALLTVITPGFAPDMEDFTMPASTKNLTIHLTRGHTLTGKVLGPTSQPVAGTYAEIYSWRGKHTLFWQGFRTDAAGEFTWSNAPADAVVFYFQGIPGDGPRLVSLKAGPKPTIIRWLPPVHIHGTIIDAQSGKPIEGAFLYPGYYSRQVGVYWQPAIAVPEGQFDFQQTPTDNLLFEARAAGYVFAYSRYLKSTEKDVTLTFKLKKQ